MHDPARAFLVPIEVATRPGDSESLERNKHNYKRRVYFFCESLHLNVGKRANSNKQTNLNFKSSLGRA